MSSNNVSSETARNFDDFNNMFKGIDRDDYTPDDIASIVFEKVRLEHNQSRLDDVLEWFEENHFYKIRDWVNEVAHESRFPQVWGSDDESEVSDIKN